VKLFGGRLPRGPVLPAHGMSKSRPFGAALRGRPSGPPFGASTSADVAAFEERHPTGRAAHASLAFPQAAVEIAQIGAGVHVRVREREGECSERPAFWATPLRTCPSRRRSIPVRQTSFSRSAKSPPAGAFLVRRSGAGLPGHSSTREKWATTRVVEGSDTGSFRLAVSWDSNPGATITIVGATSNHFLAWLEPFFFDVGG
jgi:hypothetical protein